MPNLTAIQFSRSVFTIVQLFRITQPPGGNSSNILDLQEENGNKMKPYRMASSFVLGDEQPDNNNTKSWDIQTGDRI